VRRVRAAEEAEGLGRAAVIARIRKFLADRRHRKAERYRRMAKRSILIADIHDYFAGVRTAEESMLWRQYAYSEIDKFTDDEILEMF
jgi:hypothetical protein